MQKTHLSDPAFISDIIDLAWDDTASFDAIEAQTGLKEKQVIAIMRRNLKPSSFRLWRKRVTGRSAKHARKEQFSNAQQDDV